MKRVLLDCDGPLSDFDERALRVLEGHVPEDWQTPLGVWSWLDALSPDLRLYLTAHCVGSGFAAQMNAVDGAEEALERLQKLAQVYVVTTPWPNSPFWPAERIKWLEERGVPHDKIVLTSAKYVVRGDILVDDRPENLLKWLQHHPSGTAVLWKTRGNFGFWNDLRFVLMDGWSDERFWSEVER